MAPAVAACLDHGLPRQEQQLFLDACTDRYARSFEAMRWNAQHLGGVGANVG